MLTPDRERAALSLFAQAIEREHLDIRSRLEWLEAASDHEPVLMRRVIDLIEADNELLSLGQEIGAPPELPPDMIGESRLEALIGAGGLTTVYRARRDDGFFGEKMQVRFFRSEREEGGLAREVEAERRVQAQLPEGFVARMLKVSETPGGLKYLTTEYITGDPVDAYASAARLSVEERVSLILQAATTLSQAHALRAPHGDIKSRNILVTAEGQVTLIDFGTVRLQEMAGEAGRAATLADDVHALARVLFSLLTGVREADAGEAPQAALSLKDLPKGKGLYTILTTALAADPQMRYQTMQAFEADLSAWLMAEPEDFLEADILSRAERFAHRRPVTMAIGAGLAGALLAVLGLTFLIG